VNARTTIHSRVATKANVTRSDRIIPRLLPLVASARSLPGITAGQSHVERGVRLSKLVNLITRRRITIVRMAMVQYNSRENAGHKFWTARYGRHAIRIDANRPGVFKWLISLERNSVRKGVAPNRDKAAAAVRDALDELPR
jgi:hypothetical protein